LAFNVTPIARRLELICELFIEHAPHLDDALGHPFYLPFPVLKLQREIWRRNPERRSSPLGIEFRVT
jgi:hypothetical protein